MPIARFAMPFACLVVLAALASGCGGGSDDAATAEQTTLDKATYLKRANAGCRKVRKGLEEEVSDFLALQRGKKPPREMYADLAHLVILPVIESEMEAVRALGAPPGDEDAEREIDYLLYVEEAALNELALTNEVASREAIERRFTKSGKLLSEYGLPSCANGLAVQDQG